MRTLILVIVAAVCFEGFFTAAASVSETADWWEDYKKEFGKSYANAEEEQLRKQICWEKKQEIEKHNAEFAKGLKTFEMGLNEFSDMTYEEFSASKLGFLKGTQTKGISVQYNASRGLRAPESFDWRNQGAVTGVKNQGGCGSCWAFSSTGCLEGQYFRTYGQLLSFSEQQLVDCSRGFGTNGCSGAWMNNAFQYVASIGGIALEDNYPYEGQDLQCRSNSPDARFNIKTIYTIPQGDENTLMQAVYERGPVAVAIDASQGSFGAYKSGVYFDSSCTTTIQNHAVLVVGYGVDSNYGDYWLVKNSWGAGWGDQGYIKMARNRGNACGIVTTASFVEL